MYFISVCEFEHRTVTIKLVHKLVDLMKLFFCRLSTPKDLKLNNQNVFMCTST